MVLNNFDTICDSCYIRFYVYEDDEGLLYEISSKGEVVKIKSFKNLHITYTSLCAKFIDNDLLWLQTDLNNNFKESEIYNAKAQFSINLPFYSNYTPFRIINGNHDYFYCDTVEFYYQGDTPYDNTVMVMFDKKTGSRLGNIRLDTQVGISDSLPQSFQGLENFDLIWQTLEGVPEHYYGVLYYQLWQKGQMLQFYPIDSFPINNMNFPAETVEPRSILNLTDDRIAYTKYPYNWGEGDWVLNYIEYDLRERKTVFRDTLNYNPRLNLSPKVVRVNQNYLLVSDNHLYMVDSLRNRRTLFSCDKCEIVDFMVGYKE